MKKLLIVAALLAVLTPFVSSCEQESAPETETPVFSEKAVAYETVVRIPLTEGNPANGERDHLDQSRVAKENIAILKPVIDKIWADVDAGRLASYPPEQFSGTKVEGSNFAATMKARLLGKKSPVAAEYLTTGVEVFLKGMSGDGTSTREASALRFVWIDVDRKLPDMNFCLVPASELTSYTVETETGSQPLLAYLTARSYDGYNIALTTDKGTRGCRNYEEAHKMEIMIAQGEADQLMSY